MDTAKGKVLAEIAAVCSGDSGALERLLAEYAPLIESYVTSLTASGADEFEVRSEASYALYRAALSFDTEQENLTFGLYAKICIKNHLISKFIRRRRAKADVSLDELYHAGEGEISSLSDSCEMPGDRLAERESLQTLYRRIREVLSSYEWTVFHLWAEGYSAAEIARRMDRTEKSVSNALARSLAKLRRTLS